jgi:membrane associated rhomboid family serine protease
MSGFRSSSGFMSSVPMVTKNLIIINAILWVASYLLPRAGIHLETFLGLRYIGSDSFNLSQVITYMFMHDPQNPAHVFFNMFGVYMFGRILEQVWGPKRFLLFYVVTGIGAALVQELMWYIQLRPLLEAANNYVATGDASLLGNILDLKPGVNYPVEYLQQLMIQIKQNYMDSFITIGASGCVFGILLGFWHALSQCSAVPDVYPCSYQSQVHGDWLRCH